MKIICSLIMCLVVVLFFIGCGGAGESAQNSVPIISAKEEPKNINVMITMPISSGDYLKTSSGNSVVIAGIVKSSLAIKNVTCISDTQIYQVNIFNEEMAEELFFAQWEIEVSLKNGWNSFQIIFENKVGRRKIKDVSIEWQPPKTANTWVSFVDENYITSEVTRFVVPVRAELKDENNVNLKIDFDPTHLRLISINKGNLLEALSNGICPTNLNKNISDDSVEFFIERQAPCNFPMEFSQLKQGIFAELEFETISPGETALAINEAGAGYLSGDLKLLKLQISEARIFIQ